jgi:hypothetical protein
MSATRSPACALCVLAPVIARGARPLDAELRSLPEGSDSPFARLDTLHVARLVVIPALEGRDGAPLEPPQPYVLFAADFDGSLEDSLVALTEYLPAECATIWGRCPGWPQTDDAAARRRFLREHRVALGFSIAPYRGTSVAEVREALDVRERLTRFAIGAQGLNPVELMEGWRREFESVPGPTRSPGGSPP